MDFIDEQIEQYAHDHTEDEGELLNRLKKETHASLDIPQMLTGRIEGRFLNLLVKISNARRVVEVGTFSGYGSLSMAEALPEDGELFTCEIDPDAIAVAQKYFDESPHGKKIKLLEGEALTSISTVPGPIDFAFIDADKANYLNYYQALLPKMRKGGLIAVDNVLWSGRVLHPVDDWDRAIANFNETVKRDDRVEHVFLTVRDGIYLLRVK
ncbi:MAG: methyltransferase [Candidatus Nitronauta litoralis]|uniref:Methyltransferase n=1 Tax=Candidatus Nitronauta litoralis TaxID=2705533 RepID=A0A7T0G0M9_9BACT|nr:MAG: methyltransferase [Candidatus Nitronauta litoralis]